MAMNCTSASKDDQWATVPFRGCQFNPESFPQNGGFPPSTEKTDNSCAAEPDKSKKPATLPNATLDKAILEAQIRKVNGGSALAVALLMISR